MSSTHTVYLDSATAKWSELVEDAKREARRASGHKEWTLDSIDEYHREVGVYNDHGKRTGTTVEAKVIVRKA